MSGYNDVTATVNGVAHASVGGLVIMCICGAVRMEGVLAFMSAYLGSVVFATYGKLASMYGGIDAASKSFLKVVRRTSLDASVVDRGLYDGAVKREIRSMRVLRVMAGPTFCYDKPLFLTFVGIILVQSVNLMIMQ